MDLTAEHLGRDESGPSPRRSVGGVLDDSVYMIGGSGRMTESEFPHFSEVWRFDLSSRKWELVSKDTLPRIRVPGCSKIDGAFYVFGGREDRMTFHNDVWRIDGQTVECVPVEGERPPVRYAVAQASLGGDIYIYGGMEVRELNESYKVYGDLWRFDVDRRTWHKLSEDGPSLRYGSAMEGRGNELTVFGGRYRTPDGDWRYTDETWRYDLNTGEWQEVATAQSPSPRYGSGTIRIGDKVIMFGGMSKRYRGIDTPLIRRLDLRLRNLPVRNDLLPTLREHAFHNDVWVYDMADREWRCIAEDTPVPPLKTPIVDTHSESLIVGTGNHGTKYYGSFWTLTPLEAILGAA